MAKSQNIIALDVLLHDVETFIRKYVYLGEAEGVAAALWVAHTWTFGAAECTPYLNITSAEKQSGKTRLLEALAQLVAKPWFTARVSSAVLTRKIEKKAPTLLLDETDSAFKADKEYAEALRGVLNSGYRKGGTSSLCVKIKGEYDAVDLASFCPKALAGLGQLPDTVADRSIRINLKRRAPGETVARFRLREAEAEASPLKYRLERWADAAITELSQARPPLPEQLSDRAADVWEPLLAIADMAGGDWPGRARQAALTLAGFDDDDNLSLRAQLLRDIALVLDGRDDTISSAMLVQLLTAHEEMPWGDLYQRALDPRKLAKLLKPYGIKPQTVRKENETFKGYYTKDFKDAFLRYVLIPQTAVTTDTSVTKAETELNLENESVTGVTDVTAKKGIQEKDDIEAALNMPINEALKIWYSEGAPLIHLGPGENCENLEKLLTEPIKPEQLEAVRVWLEEHKGGEQ